MIYTVEELLPVLEANTDNFCGMTETDLIALVEMYATRAEAYIDRMSFYRLKEAAKEFPEDVKKTICIVSELMYKENIGGNAVSENTDGYAVTYKEPVSVYLKGKIKEVCMDFLGHTGIFQRSMGVM